MFSCEIREIFKNSFFFRAPLVAAIDYFCSKTDSKEKGVSIRCVKIAFITI